MFRNVSLAKRLLLLAAFTMLIGGLGAYIVGAGPGPDFNASIQNATGKVIYLRTNDIGVGYGPSTDFLDAEVIFALDATGPNVAYGFKLRNDSNGSADKAAFDLLRDAFTNNWTVQVGVNTEPGKSNHLIVGGSINVVKE
ncbi:hypothetical protein HYR53_10750 [Candidatus Acetothermia bacterium]|nr:hypothetical protein [Candidatus Acetothermia bacterium]